MKQTRPCPRETNILRRRSISNTSVTPSIKRSPRHRTPSQSNSHVSYLSSNFAYSSGEEMRTLMANDQAYQEWQVTRMIMVTNSHVCSMCSFSLILAEISQTMCCYTAGSTTVRFNIACELLKNVPKGKKRFKLPIYPNLSCLSTDSKQAGFFLLYLFPAVRLKHTRQYTPILCKFSGYL